jgi:hypothetical protein
MFVAHVGQAELDLIANGKEGQLKKIVDLF